MTAAREIVERVREACAVACERLLADMDADAKQHFIYNTGQRARMRRQYIDCAAAIRALDLSHLTPPTAPDKSAVEAEDISALLAELDALEAKATPGEWMVYDSNSWRRIGMKHGYQEILWPCKASDGHPDLGGKNREDDLALLIALRNAYPKLRSLAIAGREDLGPNDTGPVFFYERDYYVLSNFSAFRLRWMGCDFDTSEHAYHWMKFGEPHKTNIRVAPSAHEAFKYAEIHKSERRPHWGDMKVDIMRDILRTKAEQHEYVRRKLLQTGDRLLVENSWRDDYWGWGPNCDGQNMLGKLWMEVRAELASSGSDGGGREG